VNDNGGLAYGHTFASVHVNDKTGHTYLISIRSGAWAPGGFNVITLDSSGAVTDSVSTNFYGGLTTVNGGNSLADGSMAIVGSYSRSSLKGAFYIILNASGSVKTSIKVLGETDNDNTAFVFQSHPLATILSNSNILWVGAKGILEFNSDMSSIVSYKSLTGVRDISERADGSFAVLSDQVVASHPQSGQATNAGWCFASFKILNSDRTQIVAKKEIYLGENPYISIRLDGSTSKLDRYVFMPENSKTLISLNSSVDYWQTTVSPLGKLTILTFTTTLPSNISSLANPTITDPNFSYSTTSTLTSDYIGSMTVDNPTDFWTFYSYPT
jgi:hypothetical protein